MRARSSPSHGEAVLACASYASPGRESQPKHPSLCPGWAGSTRPIRVVQVAPAAAHGPQVPTSIQRISCRRTQHTRRTCCRLQPARGKLHASGARQGPASDGVPSPGWAAGSRPALALSGSRSPCRARLERPPGLAVPGHRRGRRGRGCRLGPGGRPRLPCAKKSTLAQIRVARAYVRISSWVVDLVRGEGGGARAGIAGGARARNVNRVATKPSSQPEGGLTLNPEPLWPRDGL